MAARTAYPQTPDSDTAPVQVATTWPRFAMLPAQLALNPDRSLRTAKLVLLALAAYADRDHRCWPSLATLAEASGLDRANVRDALDRAEAAGYLRRERRRENGRWLSTVYTLTCPPEGVGAPPPPPRGATAPRGRGATAPLSSTRGEQHHLPLPPAPNGAGPQHDPAEVRQVFDAWAASLPAGTTRQLTEPRRKAIRARLREGYAVADLCAAAQGWVADPWPERPQHNDLTVLLRSGGSVEKFAALHRDGPAPTVHQAMLAGHGTDVLRPRNRFLPNP